MEKILFQTVDWATVPVTEFAGETGFARQQTIQHDRFRLRLVEYSKEYRSERWCTKGRLVFCLEGEMISELDDGRTYTIGRGMSYEVSDNASRHRFSSKDGVKLLIIDGTFLENTLMPRNPWRI